MVPIESSIMKNNLSVLTRLKDAKPQFLMDKTASLITNKTMEVISEKAVGGLMDAVSTTSPVIDALTNSYSIITPSVNQVITKVTGKSNVPVKSERKGFYITLILSATIILTVTYVINKKRENN
jgi:hypothetical protein